MPKRVRSLQRVLSVQSKLESLEAAKLAQTQRSMDALTAEEADLIARLNCEAMPEAMFARSAFARLQTSAVKSGELAEKKRRQSEAVSACARKVKLCETMLQAAQIQARLRGERDALSEILAVLALRIGGASL